jgi:hypothetical protein
MAGELFVEVFESNLELSSIYLIDSFVVMKNALNIANIFRQTLFTELLHDVSILPYPKIFDKFYKIDMTYFRMHIPYKFSSSFRITPLMKKCSPTCDSLL